MDLSREKAKEAVVKQNYRDELDKLLQAALGLRTGNLSSDRGNEIEIELEEGEEATHIVIDQPEQAGGRQPVVHSYLAHD